MLGARLVEYSKEVPVAVRQSRPSFQYTDGIHEQASSRQKASNQDTNDEKADFRQKDSFLLVVAGSN